MNTSFDYYLKSASDLKAEATGKISEEENNIRLAKEILEKQSKVKRILTQLNQYEAIAERREGKINKITNMYQDYLGFKVTQCENKNNVIAFTLDNVCHNNLDKKCTLLYNVESSEIISCHPSLKNLNKLMLILSEEDNWPKFLLTLRENWKVLKD